MRIAVDFDGTLCEPQWPYIGEQRSIHKLIMWWVKHRQKKGDIVILNTCRIVENGTLPRALKWLKNHGLAPDFVNENDPKLIATFGDCRKISADRYIDDLNVGLLGWLLRRYRNAHTKVVG